MQRVKRKNRGDLGEERIMPKLVKERPPPKKIREKQKDQAKKEFIRKVAEDASWEDNRPKKKHEKKREEQELKRDVILAKKFERKQLEAEEDEAIQYSFGICVSRASSAISFSRNPRSPRESTRVRCAF
eukprot:m.277136 g.277136  ORF g.277136 m.277136 type:complete len:129 (-) comp19781_c0_seq6:2244-2630(-)